jgi:hypothetical protein
MLGKNAHVDRPLSLSWFMIRCVNYTEISEFVASGVGGEGGSVAGGVDCRKRKAQAPRQRGASRREEKAHYAENILDFGREEAQIWGRLRVPHPENALDKQIAATTLVYDLPLVTRNVKDFAATGVTLLNPFE